MASFGEGNAVKDLIWFIGLLIMAGVLWVVMGGPANFERTNNVGGHATSSSRATSSRVLPWWQRDIFSAKGLIPTETTIAPVLSSGSNTAATVAGVVTDPTKSRYFGQVKLRFGQSFLRVGNTNEEYLTLVASYSNKQDITISGWSLDNGLSGKYYDVYGRLLPGRSTIVRLPYGTQLLTGRGGNVLGPITLAPSGQAAVVTGRIPNTSPEIVDSSFRVNKCSGYLARLDNYRFVPSLSTSCPSYDEEFNVKTISDECYRLARNYGRNCRTPKVKIDPERGELVDSQAMSSACKKIILATFNYEACWQRHRFDKDFYSKDWRIYLNYTKGGLWAYDRATITLYDNEGKIVDQLTY